MSAPNMHEILFAMITTVDPLQYIPRTRQGKACKCATEQLTRVEIHECVCLQHDKKGNTETWNPAAAPSMAIIQREHSGGRKRETSKTTPKYIAKPQNESSTKAVRILERDYLHTLERIKPSPAKHPSPAAP